MKITAAIGIVLAAVLVVGAQIRRDEIKQRLVRPPQVAEMPAPPKPGPEMAQLRALVGTWTTEEVYEATSMGPGGTGSGVNTTRLGPGGFSILMDQRSKGTMGAFSGHGVYAWDAAARMYRASWVDSMTAGLQFWTGRKEGDTLVFTGEVTLMDGKKIATRDVWSDFTPTSHTITSYYNDGSGEKKSMTIQFTRQEK